MIATTKIVQARTYFLEMKNRPAYNALASASKLEFVLWKSPEVTEYLELYKLVGDPWGWTGRLLKSLAEVEEILQHPRNFIFRAWVNSQLVGFAELDARPSSEIEVSYMGLLPEFIGKGFGSELLRQTVWNAWDIVPQPDRILVHTCEYDHPNALEAYKRAGFTVYDERVLEEPYPIEYLATHAQV